MHHCFESYYLFLAINRNVFPGKLAQVRSSSTQHVTLVSLTNNMLGIYLNLRILLVIRVNVLDCVVQAGQNRC